MSLNSRTRAARFSLSYASVPVALAVLLSGNLVGQPPPDDCVIGWFSTPYQHANANPAAQWPEQWDQYGNMAGAKYRAMHMALIPVGPYQGRVIVWDGDELADPDGIQLWSIVKPEADNSDPDKFLNFKLSIPPNTSPQRARNLGCAGHAWLPDGRLVVLGGTELISNGIEGTAVTYIFDSRAPLGNGMWTLQVLMAERRWYPSGTLFQNDSPAFLRILASGGSPSADTYEAAEIVSGSLVWRRWGVPPTDLRLFPGPSVNLPTYYAFSVYPRLHLLGNAQVSRTGWPPDTAAITHLDGAARATWVGKGVTTPHRWDGAAILHPNTNAKFTNAVMILGGAAPPAPLQPLDSVQICKASAAGAGSFDSTPTQGWDWKALAPMNHKRYAPNAIVLPDGKIMVFGGENNTVGGVNLAERYDTITNTWEVMAVALSNHGYHSTALLLPSGRVLLAGGEPGSAIQYPVLEPNRTYDYEIYNPPYLCNPRPVITSWPTQPLSRIAQPTIQFTVPVGTTITRVALTRPGSVTHSFDFDQRYLQVPFEITGSNSLAITNLPAVPGSALGPDAAAAPSGQYMLWLLNSQGTASEAKWVELQ